MAENLRGNDAAEVLQRLFLLIGPYNKKGIALAPATTFAGDLEFDSLTVMDLVAAIEDEFDIVLPLNLLPELETVQQVADAVVKIRAKK
ncbi:MAG TPA: acyl carrier protein [Sphingomonadales bacterium]|nr:acyl carrier protein [Sphingomonadales bacterium]